MGSIRKMLVDKFRVGKPTMMMFYAIITDCGHFKLYARWTEDPVKTPQSEIVWYRLPIKGGREYTTFAQARKVLTRCATHIAGTKKLNRHYWYVSSTVKRHFRDYPYETKLGYQSNWHPKGEEIGVVV